MLKNAKYKDFGIHKDLELTFQKGLNAIVGPNRAGKTQIMESMCYGLFGKTQNSKLEKIINFDSEKVEVNLEFSEFNLKRGRSRKGNSTLSGVKKIDLDRYLKLNYQEFLSIFYISSSHEQKSLFDPSYLRQFLISLFDLDKYAKIQQQLKAEYNGLKIAQVEVPKINKDLIKKRFDKVKKFIVTYREELTKYETIEKRINAAQLQLAQKKGILDTKRKNLKEKYYLLKSGKCSKCARPYSEKAIKLGLKKIKEAFNKLDVFETKLKTKQKEIDLKEVSCDKKSNLLISKINRAKQILAILKERVRLQEPVKVNTKRIKELEKIIPIFDAKGFPSYLLKTYIPLITETANQLLTVIFPDTVIDIRTERPDSNRPDFKPFIHRGKEILEMRDLCASERVLVNLCFRLGIMVIFKQLCETSIDFFLIDEGFEVVDDVNCLKVISLLEGFLSMGYLKQVILVSHKIILKTQENINYIELGGSNGNSED